MVERIKRLCKEQGISLNALEIKAGLGRNNIRRWDSYTPSIDKVKMVADCLGVSLGYLLGDENGKGVNNTLQKAFDERPEMRMLFSVAESATKEEIETAIKIINALKGNTNV